MNENRASLTAYRVALSRAAHQLLDRPAVLADPVALDIIGPQGVAEIRADPGRFDAPAARSLRAFLVARSRYAEEALARAAERGVDQYVVLGAGLDTFAWRNPYPPQAMRVFEVDHPATQAWKRDMLRQAGIAAPEALTWVAVDFEAQAWLDGLRQAGFRTDRPAFFSWLGVTMYLDRPTVLGTLRGIAAAMPAGSGVAFDYATPLASLDPARRAEYERLLRRVAAVGEPWKSFFDPAGLDAALGEMGYRQREDLGLEEINARYFARHETLRAGGLGRLALAVL